MRRYLPTALAALMLLSSGCDRGAGIPSPWARPSGNVPDKSPGNHPPPLVSKQAAKGEEVGWRTEETAHYVIHLEEGGTGRPSDVGGRQLLRELESEMELLFGKYSLAFRFSGPLSGKAVVKVYRDDHAYHAAGGPIGTAAYFNPRTKELAASRDGGWKASTFQILCHEGCHQFFDLAFPGFYDSPDLPMWFSEGLADCFGASEIRGSELYAFTLTGLAAERIPVVKEAMRLKRRPSLGHLLAMGRTEFMSDPEVHYACSWSLVHFLWNAPSLDSGDGTYRSVVVRLIEGLKGRRPRGELYRDAFRHAGSGIDLEKLDREWESYVRTLRTRR